MENHCFKEKTEELLLKYYKELANIKTCRLPHRIYHYTSTEGLKGIISENELWFSDIEYLNDEMEVKYIYELIEKIIANSEIKLCNQFKELLLSRYNHIKSENYFQIEANVAFNEKSFVISFSGEKDSLLLWKNYTKNAGNMGYNIGFKSNDIICSLKSIIKKEKIIYGNVIYDNKTQKDLLINLLSDFNKLYQDDRHEQKIFKYVGELLKVYALFYKKDCFKNEKEYRIVINQQQDVKGHDTTCDFRIHNGLLIPYCKYKFDKTCVESICISPTVKGQLYNASIRRFLNRHNYSNDIKILNSTIPLRY